MKALVGSGIVGGLFGVLVQAIYALYALALGASNQYIMAYSLITGGFVVMILYIVGVTDAIGKLGGFGAMIPLIGLVSGTAGGINASRKQGNGFVFTSVYLGMKLGIWEAAAERLFIFCGIIASMFAWGALGAILRGIVKPSAIKA